MSRSPSVRAAFRKLFSRRRTRPSRPSGAVRSFEVLEARLALAGINGPFDSDPTYNPNGGFHIHAGLSIYVNGEKTTIPVFSTNPEDIHTHDATGTIHIHPQSPPGRFITLGDVFDAWRTAVEGANPNAVLSPTNLMNNQVDTEHSLQMFVNGVRTDAYDDYQIHDRDQILLVYGTNPVISLQTSQGVIPVELLEDVAPNTVANFLTYANAGDYNNSVFHRYVPGFVLQGGGFASTSATFTSASQITAIPSDPPVVNEFDNWALESGTSASVTQNSAVVQLNSTADLSDVSAGDRIRLTGRTDGISGTNMFNIVSVSNAQRTITVSPSPTNASASSLAWTIFPRVNVVNTLAMAKVGGNPDSATNQFFVNLANNDSNLDLQNGGFTVFARILDTAQPQVSDTGTTTNVVNAHYTSFVSGLTVSNQGGTFGELPLAANSQLVRLQSITGQGEVKGTVFNDADANGVRGTNETGRAGVTIFVDANNNQQLDAGETSTTTDTAGNYTLRLNPGPHSIRMVPVNSLSQTTPASGYNVNVDIGRAVVGRVFGVTSLTGPTGVDLVAASDTGSSSTDNVTSLNNANAQKTLQFTVSNAAAGATLQILSDGAVIGQTVVPSGANGTVTITTNGTTSIADGTHTITAAQQLNGTTVNSATSLTLRVDSTAPAFTSTVPSTAHIGSPFNYDAQTNEDSAGNVTFTIQNAPTGATINSSTGIVTWTPTASQLGSQSFSITATDAAGNSSTQAISLDVTKAPHVRIRLAVTDTSGNPISAINVGGTFQLRAFASDPRATPTGAGAVYHDVTWDGNLASAVAGSIVHGSSFPQASSGTIAAGLLDEIGSTSASSLGGGEFLLYQVNFRADNVGTLTFIGNAPDTLPSHNVTVSGSSTAIPFDEVDFGRSPSLTVRQVTPGSLAGFVFVDTNHNGLKEATEQPIANVTIQLTGTDTLGGAVTPVSRTATTQADGSYRFDDLNPGSYKLKQVQPTGQINGLPILDGTDYVGSQGGTVSANDELTVNLAEGVNGTNNNFAELVGRTLGGMVATGSNGNGGTGQLVMPGLRLQLYAADDNNQPSGSPLQAATVQADGRFAFNGLAADTYVVQVDTPPFLQGGTQQTVLTLGNTDSLNNVLTPGGLQARYVSYRQFLSSTPRHGIFAAVQPGSNGGLWNAYDPSWQGFSQLNVTLNSTGSSVRIDATRTTGEAVFDEVPVTDERVQLVAEEGTRKLLRLAGGSASYNLRPVSTASSSNSAPAAEGESALSPAQVDAAFGAMSDARATDRAFSQLASASPESDAALTDMLLIAGDDEILN